MTANELADKLMESNSVAWGSCTHEQHDNDKYFKEQASAMLRQLQAECIDKDSQILTMQFKIKDLEYQVKMLNDLLQLKKAWRDFDVDGRC
jgi:hypothetical protein